MDFKIDERCALYYGEYRYRAHLKDSNYYHVTRKTKTISSVYDHIENMRDVSSRFKSLFSGYIVQKPREITNEDVIIDFLRFKKQYEKMVKFRYERGNIVIYFNDLDLCDEIDKIECKKTFFEVHVSPAGIKYFKTPPPANYRIYMKSAQISRNDMIAFKDYVEKLQNGSVSSSFSTKLKYGGSSGSTRNTFRIDNTNYIDLDNETDLSMLYLKYGKYLGKYYKLELSPLAK